MMQATRDALADAETLRSYFRQSGATIAELSLHPLFRASVCGYRVERLIKRRWRHRAFAEARMGASAAFRACPGLREAA